MDNKDIFKEAAKQSMKNIEKEKTSVEIIEQKSQEEIAEERTENPIDSQWLKVEKAMTGTLAERFLNVMETLPDRDFMRIYLKTLEYFKPKIIREEREKNEDRDLTINVNIVTQNKEGEVVELDLNDNTNTYE